MADRQAAEVAEAEDGPRPDAFWVRLWSQSKIEDARFHGRNVQEDREGESTRLVQPCSRAKAFHFHLEAVQGVAVFVDVIGAHVLDSFHAAWLSELRHLPYCSGHFQNQREKRMRQH